jgi:hypothetical protein
MQLGLYQSYIRPFTIPSSIFSAFSRLDQIGGVFWSQRVIVVHRLCALEASYGKCGFLGASGYATLTGRTHFGRKLGVFSSTFTV